MVTRELIERFFRNQCTAEEQKLVLDFFKANPDEFAQYLDEEEWEHFEIPENLEPGLSRKLFSKVRSRTFRKKSVVRTLVKVSVAAAVVVAIGLGLILSRDSSEQAGIKKTENPLAVSSYWVERSNTTGKPMAFSLADGSTVQLAAGSKVKFYDRFDVNKKREVWLMGEASFKVAKDKAKPFIVYSDGIATTVLGTYFTIKAFDSSDVISVALHEGKVVVHSSDSVSRKLKKAYFLSPGDELIYNKTTLLATVRNAAPDKNRQMIAASATGTRNNSVIRPNWYQFSSASLSEVFNQLSVYYRVEIYYYPEEMKNRYYSGKIERMDSLETILNDIALLNRFTITKKDGAYFIRKKSDKH